MTTKSKYLPGLSLSESDGIVTIENDYVRWVHDASRGGELVGAYVTNGTGGNLLVAPQSSSLCPWVRGGWRQYHHYETANSKATAFSAVPAPDGTVTVSAETVFTDADGKVLEGATVRHAVKYRKSGAAEHEISITLDRDIDLGFVSIGQLALRDDFDRVAVRPCSAASWAVELQNPCQWIDLHHAKSRSDLPAYRSRHLPLSVVFVKNGAEAIEMSLGDDLGAWDGIGNDFPGLAQGSVCEARDPWRYEATFAPLDSPRAGNILKAGTYRFTYRLALPFVRKNIVPIDITGTVLKYDAAFNDRWPSQEELAEYAQFGVRLQRVHNDGDCYGNGIFWRDVSYPPYPADEMAKMDATLNAARNAGIDVVPYFSCKEWHPEAGDFAALGEKCARRVVKGEKFMETFFGTSLFGIQMCLESDWYKVRRDAIEKVLDNHAFSGLYYDWCMGLECINENHNGGRRHWDNDRLLDLMEWSRAKIGEEGKLNLHLTNVPSLAIENLGDNILVEESEYFEIFPEMFTPQVHFVNIAPRSICVMLPADKRTPGNMRALALAALLHHAALCVDYSGKSRYVLEFYKEHEKELAELTKYEHHAAPGEGITSTGGSKAVGMSAYWTRDKALGLLANLTNEKQSVDWSVSLGDGREYSGRRKIAPLDFVLFEL